MKALFKTIAISFLITIKSLIINGQSLTRDLNVGLLTNQIGYTSHAPKTCVTKGKVNRPFQVVEIATFKVVYEGTLKPKPGDFGDYSVGDFSNFTQEGRFYLTSDSLRSFPFVIKSDLYRNGTNLIIQYFAQQRCGPSLTGYLSPCHLDDGIRIDNGKHQNVAGGWHDASDLRKWIAATIYGMLGLAKAPAFEQEENKKKEILEELMWGNQYFLKMQEPQGYIMDFIGGEIRQGGDNNRWTDNHIGKEGGEMQLIKPNAGKSGLRMMVFGSQDDRIIQTRPADIISQYNFITAEAFMARVTKDKNYAKKCLLAAEQCFKWSQKQKSDPSPLTLGGSILSSLELYKMTRSDKYKLYAIGQAALLKKLQAETIITKSDTLGGFFYAGSGKQEPYKNIWNGCMELISICDLIEAFPSHADVPGWKEMISKYSYNYLSVLANRNSFGLIPFGLFDSEQDPDGNRKIGKYWYRYFMYPKDWWVGINANIAASGVGLIKASRILNDPSLKLLAQRQLDWIAGTNPFNSSTIVGVGYNQPKQFINGSEFKPETPVIPGAVMNGLGGDAQDNPDIGTGNYNVSEYWTPMVAYTLWLMTEVSREK